MVKLHNQPEKKETENVFFACMDGRKERKGNAVITHIFLTRDEQDFFLEKKTFYTIFRRVSTVRQPQVKDTLLFFSVMRQYKGKPEFRL